MISALAWPVGPAFDRVGDHARAGGRRGRGRGRVRPRAGKRLTLRRMVSGLSGNVLVVEHRDLLARFGVVHLEAALGAQGRRVVVADAGETTDDLVRGMIEVLTSMGAQRYGRRGVRNRVMRAVTATQQKRAAVI